MIDRKQDIRNIKLQPKTIKRDLQIREETVLERLNRNLERCEDQKVTRIDRKEDIQNIKLQPKTIKRDLQIREETVLDRLTRNLERCEGEDQKVTRIDMTEESKVPHNRTYVKSQLELDIDAFMGSDPISIAKTKKQNVDQMLGPEILAMINGQ